MTSRPARVYSTTRGIHHHDDTKNATPTNTTNCVVQRREVRSWKARNRRKAPTTTRANTATWAWTQIAIPTARPASAARRSESPPTTMPSDTIISTSATSRG